MAPVLGKVQIGKESQLAHGTPVAATVIWPMKQKPLQPDSKPTPLSHDIGVNVEVTGNFVQGKLVQDSFSLDQVTFEMLPYLHSGLLAGDITPVEQTEGEGDYLWDNTPALDGTDNKGDSFTLQRGDTVQAVVQEYVMFKRLKLSGTIDQGGGASPVKAEVDYFGRQNTNGSFTAGLAPIAAHYLSAKLSQIYLDTSWAGVGGTEVAGVLRAFDLEIIGGFEPKFNGSTVETFTEHEQGPLSFMLALTLKRGTVTEALRAATGEFRAARLKMNGVQIGSGLNRMAQYDLGGYIEDVVAMAEDDKGAKLDTLVLHGQYDRTGAKLIVPKVITAQSSI